MPRISLDTAPTTSERSPKLGLASWCERLWNSTKRTRDLAAAVALAFAGVGTANAQVMPTPVYSDTGAQAIWPAGATTSALPWPAISPYQSPNVLSTQHVNQNGLWMKNVYQKQREFYFSVEAAYFDFGEPGDSIIGADTLKIDSQGQLVNTVGLVNPSNPFAAGGGGGGGLIAGTALDSLFDQVSPSFILAGTGVFPYSLTSFDDTVATEATLDFAGNNTAHPLRYLGDLGQVNSAGTRLRWGFDNGDGSGFELTGFVSGEGEANFTRGVSSVAGVPLSQELLNLNEANLGSLQNGAISYDNGLPTFPTVASTVGITGATQKFDLLYDARHRTHVAGASASIFNTPIISADAVRVRFVWGGDYLYIDEEFSFRGIDSGLAIDLEDYQSDEGELPSGTGGGGGGQNDVLDTRFGGNTTDIVTPELTPFSPDTFFETQVTSLTQSHLAGPTVGFRYEFGGGKKFSVWGETIVGLFANIEQNSVRSHNAAEQSHSKTVYGLDPFAESDGSPRPDNYTRSSDDKSLVHVSPMFKQAIHGELGLSSLFPDLRNNPFIEDGFITAGYSATIIGSVQRPGEAIYWRGYNGDPATSFPIVDSDRSTFVMQEINLGVEWTY